MNALLRSDNPFRGFRAIFYKEQLHLRRDSMAIMFALAVPILQMIILGYAIDTNVRQVKTAVYDQTGIMEHSAGTQGSQASRALLDRFRNSDTFKIYKYVHSDKELTQEMIAGRAKVGIKIPYDFDRELLRGETAQIMVMVDGSDSSVAGQAMNVAQGIGLDESLRRMLPPGARPPIEVRPKVMFNPDSRSPNFFLPGLMTVLLLFVTTMLTAFSIVREKERGTLEQLFVTPVRPLGLMMGKIMPYFALAMVEMSTILLFMHFIFRVPIHGNVLLLLALATLYMFAHLALGMLISSKANSQNDAMQRSMGIMLPTIFLSGYIFPRETMPLIFYGLSFLLPATYMMDIARGIILRGAGFMELWKDALVLAVMGIVILMLAARNFRKMIV
ncbi:MAG: ABC transporter permease [Terriglobales bacterium]